MRDTVSPQHDSLLQQARLYVGGDLTDTEADAFEQRLADDQAARDALVRAVQERVPSNGRLASGPDPAYRLQVKKRLRRRQSYRGRPLFWSVLGAVAAMLAMVIFTPPPPPSGSVVQAPLLDFPGEDVDPVVVVESEDPPGFFDLAKNLSDPPRHVRDDERPRVRAEDRPPLASGPDRRERPLSNTSTRPGSGKPGILDKARPVEK